jgi:tRNA pseudouridine38-40 synthase
MQYQRYKAIVEYDGKQYFGMQKQNEMPTIQLAIEKAITAFASDTIKIEFCGRTDRGVHALAQVIHFDLYSRKDCYKILSGVNFYLRKNNDKISIISVTEVDSNFNARFSCKSRKYLYKIINRQSFSPIEFERALHIPFTVNCNIIDFAAQAIVGVKMNFSSFKSSECIANPYRTIDEIVVKKHDDTISIYITAQSFLHNMVRIIVGTLLEISYKCEKIIHFTLQGKSKNEILKEIFSNNKIFSEQEINTLSYLAIEEIAFNLLKKIATLQNRSFAGPTVSPYGLYFLEAKY